MDCKTRALELAVQGIYPVPQYSNCKACLIKWSKEATLDPEKIKTWPWEEASGLAIITGPSRLAVVDVDRHDPEKDGLESLKRFEADHGPLPETYTEQSPGGGLHMIYRLPEGMADLNFSGAILPGLEIKSSRSLVTIAPSRRQGKPYIVVKELPFADVPVCIVEAVNKVKADTAAPKARALAARQSFSKSPGKALAFSNGRRERYGQKALEEECARVREATEGSRNSILNVAALKVFRNVASGHIDEQEAYNALLGVALACGLTEQEARKTIESGKAKGMTEPREPEERPFTVNRDQYREDSDAQEGNASGELPFGFCYGVDGALQYVTYDDKGEVKERARICEHVEVAGRTYGAAKWGYVLQWRDRRGTLKQLAIPSRLFARTNTDLAELLADEGLDLEPGQHKRFKQFVLGFGNNLPIIRNVDRVGWYESCFVLPDATIGAGPNSEKVILQSTDSGLSELYQTGGTLEKWQEMAALCAGNTRLEFGLALAFSGPLLTFAPDAAGAIFSFCGRSSCGKTTALTVSASVWGYPDKQARSWRLTDNGLESVCTLFNDGVLYLDELGQVEADALQNIAYMFGSGTGKTRARRDGGTKNVFSWRSVALSSGEVSFGTKLRESGFRIYAGQQVRFIDLPVSTKHMQALNGMPSAKALSEELTMRSKLDFGLAGRAFLTRLVQDVEDVRKKLPGMIRLAEQALCPLDVDGQVLRVARRFALVNVGGQLAQEYGILPGSLNIADAVQECFNDWLAARGTLGSAEEQAILKAIRLFIEQHGNSRFQDEDNPQKTCFNRVGVVKTSSTGKREYFFFQESFSSEVAKGFETRQVLRVLEAARWLKTDQADRNTYRLTFEGKRQYFYCISLPEEDGGQ